MREDETSSLWSFGEPEPWRRGRFILAFFGITTALFQGLILAGCVLTGNIEQLLAQGIATLIFWFQFYFIWIGVHWVRWLQGFISALWGFALMIWGVRDGLLVLICLGLYSFAFGIYIACAPSVYFFAKHQRETRRWSEFWITSAVFSLLIISMASAIVGLSAYRTHRELEARHFSDTALRRIFAQHDTYFFLDHVSENLTQQYSHLRLTKFLQDATIRAGDVQNIGPATGRLHLSFRFPLKLSGFGLMRAKGDSERGPIEMRLMVIEADAGWQIDQVTWFPVPAQQVSSKSRN